MAGLRDARRPRPGRRRRQPWHDRRREVACYTTGSPEAPSYPQYPASGRSPKSPDSPRRLLRPQVRHSLPRQEDAQVLPWRLARLLTDGGRRREVSRSKPWRRYRSANKIARRRTPQPTFRTITGLELKIISQRSAGSFPHLDLAECPLAGWLAELRARPRGFAGWA